MSGKRKKGKMYFGMGEWRTVSEWWRHPECQVKNISTLRKRLELGWTVPDAIKRKKGDSPRYARKDATLIYAFGTRKSISEWAKDPRCKVSRSALRKRIRDGVPWAEAISSPPQKREKIIEAFGEKKTASEWASDPRCKVDEVRLRRRYFDKGWRAERAITRRVDKRS